AAGISGNKPFAVIDTEAGRIRHYADQFNFDAGDLKAPFSPDAYREAILAADSAGYPCIVVDSMSHEWSGESGVLELQEAELDRMAGDNWQKREACKMAAWIKPKMAHKKMVQRLLQVRAHLILCFRAEEKIEMVRDDKGKMQIVPKTSLTGINGWIPITEKSLPFELTASFLLTADAPGMPKPIKLQEQHKPMFPLDQPISEESGRKITAWATGTAISTAIPESELDAMVMTLDVKTLPELTAAFGKAYTRAKRIPDEAAMRKLQASYDSMKAAIAEGTV
ncbi:MAG: AAA family ATPase, partial [Candidatus Sulfotelmatobacter sp.]